MRRLVRGQQLQYPNMGECRVLSIRKLGGERWVQLEATGGGLFQKAVFWARESELLHNTRNTP